MGQRGGGGRRRVGTWARPRNHSGWGGIPCFKPVSARNQAGPHNFDLTVPVLTKKFQVYDKKD